MNLVRFRRSVCRSLPLVLAAVPLLLTTSRTLASAPTWLQTAARLQTPDYDEETDAILLHDEQITTVKENGEIETVYRRAYKILRPAGRDHGLVSVDFDDETRLTYLKGWCLPTNGKEFEVKERDAVETDMLSGSLYSDVGHKVLRIPAADPGNVIGYEYRQKRRPSVLQDIWLFQDTRPVLASRFELQLPGSWEFDAVLVNHPPIEPKEIGQNAWVWELTQLPPVKQEPSMPSWRAVAGWMGVSYFPPKAGESQKERGWRRLGQWYERLATDRWIADEGIRSKAAELTGSATEPLKKIAALATFVQQQIRYVAIEIGIGGYQPHAAPEIYSNRYGDCKDKATLLKAMLREIGIKSHYVLINSDLGVVNEDFPSLLSFDHAILAIELPLETQQGPLYAVQDVGGSKLLYFDPTNDLTPFGNLPSYLQGSLGLVVMGDGSQLQRLPLLPPVSSRLLRVAKLTLAEDGALQGSVQEVRWGHLAAQRRAEFTRARDTSDVTAVLEQYLAGNFPGFRLVRGTIKGLREFDKNLAVDYEFVADHYAKTAGNLLLLRPRVLGRKSVQLDRKKARELPLVMDSTSLETDQFEIALPASYQVDEIPEPVRLDYPFGGYQSEVAVADGILRYKRSFEIRKMWIGVDELPQFQEFMQKIADDEKAAAVLKRVEP